MTNTNDIQDKILIGGRALNALGSSRNTLNTAYLAIVTNSADYFIRDSMNDIYYLNANGHKFFAEIFKIEKGNQVASAQSLLELEAYAFVQHCQNFNFQKAADAEYAMKFLIRRFNLKDVSIVKEYISEGELSEVQKVIDSVRY